MHYLKPQSFCAHSGLSRQCLHSEHSKTTVSGSAHQQRTITLITALSKHRLGCVMTERYSERHGENVRCLDPGCQTELTPKPAMFSRLYMVLRHTYTAIHTRHPAPQGKALGLISRKKHRQVLLCSWGCRGRSGWASKGVLKRRLALLGRLAGAQA